MTRKLSPFYFFFLRRENVLWGREKKIEKMINLSDLNDTWHFEGLKKIQYTIVTQ